MNKKIDIETFGDYWENKEHALKKLYSCNSSEDIIIDFLFEGACPYFTGLIHELDKFCYLTGIPPQNIKISHPSVFLDVSPYELSETCYPPGHLLKSKQYWVDNIPSADIKEKRFGHFVGRPTTPRIKFFYDVYKHNIENQFFLSRLSGNGSEIPFWCNDNAYLDGLDYWIQNKKEQESFLHWYNNYHNVKSFDGLTIEDQYSPNSNAVANLINKFDYYDIDIVFETCSVGRTFMITEKTIRSFITKKPFIVYSSPNFVKNVQKLGFKTFDKFWSEDYDNYCLKTRYEKILQIVKDISMMPNNDYVKMMSDIQEICEFNKNHLQNLITDSHSLTEN